jgi:hypothetical protein
MAAEATTNPPRVVYNMSIEMSIEREEGRSTRCFAYHALMFPIRFHGRNAGPVKYPNMSSFDMENDCVNTALATYSYPRQSHAQSHRYVRTHMHAITHTHTHTQRRPITHTHVHRMRWQWRSIRNHENCRMYTAKSHMCRCISARVCVYVRARLGVCECVRVCVSVC